MSEYILKQLKCSVHLAADGVSGFQLAKAGGYDLILTDIGLPGISGDDLTLLIRHWEKSIGKKPIPIVGLTAHDLGKNTKKYLDIGMNKVLNKPINENEITAILKEYVKLNASSVSLQNETKPKLERDQLLKKLIDAIAGDHSLIQASYREDNIEMLVDIAHRLIGRASAISALIKVK